MKITDIRATVVSIPFKTPMLWAMGLHTGTTRTIVEVITDSGIEGIGETIGAAPCSIIERDIKPVIRGSDPFNVDQIVQRSLWRTGWAGINVPNMVPVAAIEIALWDIIGKAMNKPVRDLIGGNVREEVEFCGDFFPRYEGEKYPSADSVANFGAEIVRQHGFRTIQLYGAVFPPKEDVRTIKILRERLGPEVNIRFDVNTAWSSETAIRTLHEMQKHDLADVEDATRGLVGMARVRRSVNIPFSTHYTDIPTIVRLNSADTVAGDIHDSGGISGAKKLIAQAEGANLGFWLHSSNELGVSFAAMIHLVASAPYLIHPSQTMHPHLTDDIIQEPFEFRNGAVKVPRRPGLGVVLDKDKLERYSQFYRENGEFRFFDFDPKRPDWVPRIPAW